MPMLVPVRAPKPDDRAQTITWLRQVGDFTAIDVSALVADDEFVDAAGAVLDTENDPINKFTVLRNFVFQQVCTGCAPPLTVRRPTAAKAPSPFEIPEVFLRRLFDESTRASFDPKGLEVLRVFDSAEFKHGRGESIQLFCSGPTLGNRVRSNRRRAYGLVDRDDAAILTGWRVFTVPDAHPAVGQMTMCLRVGHKVIEDALARMIVDGAPVLTYVDANVDVAVDCALIGEIDAPFLVYVLLEGWHRPGVR